MAREQYNLIGVGNYSRAWLVASTGRVLIASRGCLIKKALAEFGASRGQLGWLPELNPVEALEDGRLTGSEGATEWYDTPYYRPLVPGSRASRGALSLSDSATLFPVTEGHEPGWMLMAVQASGLHWRAKRRLSEFIEFGACQQGLALGWDLGANNFGEDEKGRVVFRDCFWAY